MAQSSHILHSLAPRASYKQRALLAFLVIERVFRTLRERRALMQLDERALKDIGLSRADAHGEWSRSFWDLPRER
ncbi:MAG: DUF1127 domain-containing protein [Hyphomicrobium zavarzinii]|jgi:uncharacterized protein YjiS (DUF1127 family)|uniref:DUF1127 domain-containing protein n=1 Tax=Hyphomicrobium TaxID=81 RepID=UPI0003697417|nr:MULTISPECIES: DUF1127 domain-containing protein [Hyphomicrobium]MBL8844225.1 DUF1127 domain-containing protein [Hyphomicrobium zavarzinii]WBT36872.1 DUF1127 domain-containing protein [Hyphomicrobium sp. DMF-1]HML42420.1 DUF1127 domain-containing protein [Hyphomicrobium zavarzinii]